MSNTDITKFSARFDGIIASEALLGFDQLIAEESQTPESQPPTIDEDTSAVTSFERSTSVIESAEPVSTTLPTSLRVNWNSLAISGLSAGLIERLFRLAEKPDGWRGPGSKRLSPASLRNFLGFWASISENAVEPFITLAPNGNLYAEWHASWKRHLDIEFAGNDEVFYGLFHGAHPSEGKDFTAEVVNMMQSRRINPFNWKPRNA
jgi:hypothetical protein